MRTHPSDALATPFRSIAGHPYPSIQPPTTRYFVISGGSFKNCSRSVGAFKAPEKLAA